MENLSNFRELSSIITQEIKNHLEDRWKVPKLVLGVEFPYFMCKYERSAQTRFPLKAALDVLFLSFNVGDWIMLRSPFSNTNE